MSENIDDMNSIGNVKYIFPYEKKNRLWEQNIEAELDSNLLTIFNLQEI